MNSKKTVADVLFPRVRTELLRLLLLEPQQHRYVRELMGLSGLALHTVQDELRKLHGAGLLVTWSNGYHRFYRANRDHPLFEPLLRIVQSNIKLPLPRGMKSSHGVRRRSSQKLLKRPPRPMPKDWPVKWNLFSDPGQTRRR